MKHWSPSKSEGKNENPQGKHQPYSEERCPEFILTKEQLRNYHKLGASG